MIGLIGLQPGKDAMGTLGKKFWDTCCRQSGHAIVEYTLLFLLIALVALTALIRLGNQTTSDLGSVNSNLD